MQSTAADSEDCSSAVTSQARDRGRQSRRSFNAARTALQYTASGWNSSRLIGGCKLVTDYTHTQSYHNLSDQFLALLLLLLLNSYVSTHKQTHENK